MKSLFIKIMKVTTFSHEEYYNDRCWSFWRHIFSTDWILLNSVEFCWILLESLILNSVEFCCISMINFLGKTFSSNPRIYRAVVMKDVVHWGVMHKYFLCLWYIYMGSLLHFPSLPVFGPDHYYLDKVTDNLLISYLDKIIDEGHYLDKCNIGVQEPFTRFDPKTVGIFMETNILIKFH